MAGSTHTRIGISRLHYPVTALGPGRRIGIWFQGCSIHCRGCVSVDTWDSVPSSEMILVDHIEQWLSSIDTESIDGATISGGEPFDQPTALESLLIMLRARLGTDRDILVFSGYTSNTLWKEHPTILRLIDAAVVGPYVATRPTDLPLRGSSNQELQLFTPLAHSLYSGMASTRQPEMQVAFDDKNAWLIGIPQAGTMEKLRHTLSNRGVELGGCSWLS